MICHRIECQHLVLNDGWVLRNFFDSSNSKIVRRNEIVKWKSIEVIEFKFPKDDENTKRIQVEQIEWVFQVHMISSVNGNGNVYY